MRERYFQRYGQPSKPTQLLSVLACQWFGFLCQRLFRPCSLRFSTVTASPTLVVRLLPPNLIAHLLLHGAHYEIHEALLYLKRRRCYPILTASQISYSLLGDRTINSYGDRVLFATSLFSLGLPPFSFNYDYSTFKVPFFRLVLFGEVHVLR